MTDSEPKLPEYEVNWTPADCTHADTRSGMRHLHPQDCFAYELVCLRAENERLRERLADFEGMYEPDNVWGPKDD